jgi:EAL domain-containing protein (putative c-di-GMP-specific phosphodiesterase class I)
MGADQGNDVIVRSTIELASNLGLRVVAEGVETAAVHARLAALGCHLAQGFHFARPMPADQVPGWVRARARRPQALVA